MKVLFKVSNGLQSHLVDVTTDIPCEEIKNIKGLKIKECDMESHEGTYVYTWFDEFVESKNRPFWIDQSNNITIEIILR